MVTKSFWKFAQSMAMTLSCSEQNFKMIDKQMISYGQMWFHKIEVEYAFQTDILHCDSPWPRLLHKQYIPAMQYCVTDWFQDCKQCRKAIYHSLMLTISAAQARHWIVISMCQWLTIEIGMTYWTIDFSGHVFTSTQNNKIRVKWINLQHFWATTCTFELKVFLTQSIYLLAF